MSTKGKTPWITLNGKDTPDSQFAINEIKKTFDVDVDSHLSTEQKAIGLVIRRSLEEAFLWYYFSARNELLFRICLKSAWTYNIGCI